MAGPRHGASADLHAAGRRETAGHAGRRGDGHLQCRRAFRRGGDGSAKNQGILRGQGFDPVDHPGPHEGHFGLAGIQERLSTLGGTMNIESTRGKTRVSLSLPL